VTQRPENGYLLTVAPPRSGLVSSLFHDDPSKLPQEGVDVHRAPVSPAAIHFSRSIHPAALGMSSVKDYVNTGVTDETLLRRCVHQRLTTRNDE
jgi:hypothetical protein